VIPAFKRLLTDFPGAHLVLANATGEYASVIKGLLASIPTASYTEILFEEDVSALYHLFDVFIHVPINEHIEAFGQTYVEALAAAIPSVFTLSGIAAEFIEDQKNALVVPFRDTDTIHQAMVRLLADVALRNSVRERGLLDVQRFNLNSMINQLTNLYLSET
jgi:glycosyltransferase involved in cell wall biosynthesis